jgi:hypothetical protein
VSHNLDPVTWTRTLLMELTRLVPPPPKGAHALTVGDDGRLSVTVFTEGKWLSFFFDPGDENESPGVIAAGIAVIVRAETTGGGS